VFADQHFTVDVMPFRQAISAAGIRDMHVLEIGAGHGEITRLILDERPAQLRAYEIERGLCAIRHTLLDLREEAFTQASIASLRGWCIICTPPYSLLGTIREALTWLAPPRAVLLVPVRLLTAFSDFNIFTVISGKAGFDPPSKGEHAIIYRGFRIPNVQASIRDA